MTSEVKSTRSLVFCQSEPKDIQDQFIEIFRKIITPLYEKQRLPALNALSIKPSGIWYANDYLAKLLELGDTLIPVNGEMRAASSLYKRLREGGYFYHPMAPVTYWSNVDHLASPTGKHHSYLEMKKDVSPTKAFESFFERLSFVDCTTIIEIAIALLASSILGSDLFDSIVRTKEVIRLRDKAHSISGLFLSVLPFTPPRSISEPMTELVRGQTYYIRNSEKYSEKHPYGYAGGYNLVYIGDDRFLGLGLDPRGVTLQEIAKVLFDAYNEDPIEEASLMPSGKEVIDRFRFMNPKTNEILTLSFNEIRRCVNVGIAPRDSFSVEDITKNIFPIMLEKLNARRALKITEEEFSRTDFFRHVPYLVLINSDQLFEIISSIRE